MATINISLPDALRKFVEEQVKKYGYGTASEYFRDLLRAAWQRKANEHLDQLLLEGLESGKGRVVDENFWSEFHRKVAARRSSEKR